jgi:hypothetical protein
LALQFRHVDASAGLVTIAGQRPSSETGVQPTKGKRVRSVQVGSALLEAIAASRAARDAGENDWLFLCPIPRRGQYSGRLVAEPPSRKTAHDWHEAALVDAGLRDMPLHALRHTAAAAWLATGHPLIFVRASSATDRSPRPRSTTATSSSPTCARRSSAPSGRSAPQRRVRDVRSFRREQLQLTDGSVVCSLAQAAAGAGAALRGHPPTGPSLLERDHAPLVDPRLELVQPEAHRPVRRAEAHARDPA